MGAFILFSGCDGMKKILLVGGDERIKRLYNELLERGFNVDTMGVFEGDCGWPDYTFDAVVLPVPTTRDGKTVYCPDTKREIPLDIFDRLDSSVLLLCGAYTPKRVRYTDYCALDDYALLNAVPTAEGAIAEAIARTHYTLWKSRVLVIGAGRVGRILADRLLGLRADVTVSARKAADFALLSAHGIPSIHTRDIPTKLCNFDIIFNTVDADVLAGCGEQLSQKLVIDLSSKGCMDAKTAAAVGIIKLSALPGKVAPDTAGKILTDVISAILEGENI